MLDKWLGWQERNPCPYAEFAVIDVEEISDLSPTVKSHLTDLLVAARMKPGFLERMSEYLGWKAVKEDLIAIQIPKNTPVKRGDFGEALTCAILEQFHSYKFPVPKQHFKFTSSQSLTGTDGLALRVDSSGSIIEVCYIESKLRTTSNDPTKTTSDKTGVVLEAYKQLQVDYESKSLDILRFIAQRLDERGDPMFDAFASYMRDRRDTTHKDSFRISLCWEHADWKEKALEKLQENGVDMPRLSIHVIRIHNLRQVTDEAFASLGVLEVSDDD